MGVGTLPYFNDEGRHDLEAVIATVTHVVEAVSSIPGAKMLEPVPGQDIREYVESVGLWNGAWLLPPVIDHFANQQKYRFL